MRTHSGGGKKREESLPFIIMDKIRILAMEKKKNIKAFISVAGKELARANNSRFFVRQSFPFGRLWNLSRNSVSSDLTDRP